VISGFSRDVDVIRALLGYHTQASVNHLPTFRDNVSVPSSSAKKSKFFNIKDGIDTLPRNVGKVLQLDAA
jgi:hypothetical protein